jgi:hypothetical protein
MTEQITIKRTNSNDAGFQQLIVALDNELWNELNEDQAKYDQYNKVPDLTTVLVLYVDEKPTASGCIKKYNETTVEVKRMFVVKEHRGKGLSSMILKELENWAIELDFQYAILETSIHFKAARSLYTDAGYKVIDNYDQYAGLEESVCMKKELVQEESSEFRKLAGIEYFDFEEDFIEENVRCIPMIVRFKMDAAGIKLKLSEWSKFKKEERIELALKPCGNEEEAALYNNYLTELIRKRTNAEATLLLINNYPAWASLKEIPELLQEKAKEFNWEITKEQWSGLTNLQRFALTRLYRPGHENKNFPKAMKEFGLVQPTVKNI